MVSIFSWIKKEISYLIKSLPDILRGFIFFLLTFSGIICALFLRYLYGLEIFEIEGSFISTVSVIVEILSLLLCYVIFKGYLNPEEEIESPPSKKMKRR